MPLHLEQWTQSHTHQRPLHHSKQSPQGTWIIKHTHFLISHCPQSNAPCVSQITFRCLRYQAKSQCGPPMGTKPYIVGTKHGSAWSSVPLWGVALHTKPIRHTVDIHISRLHLKYIVVALQCYNQILFLRYLCLSVTEVEYLYPYLITFPRKRKSFFLHTFSFRHSKYFLLL